VNTRLASCTPTPTGASGVAGKMYGLWEVQERCDLIISRYQKYETAGEAQRTAAIAANQDFDELHSTITEMVSDLEKRADFLIKNSYSGHGRAAKVAVENTKLRQQKQQAVEACVQLRLMITRGKRLTKETIVRRMGALDQLIEQIGKIPDQIRQGREIVRRPPQRLHRPFPPVRRERPLCSVSKTPFSVGTARGS